MTHSVRAAALEGALYSIGVECAVEAHDRLAVVVPRRAEDLSDPIRREAALRLATEHGFTHVALELVDATDLVDPTDLVDATDARERAADGATLHRDQPAG